jgi:hypothetical protein
VLGAGCATGPPPGLWLCQRVCAVWGPSPSLRLASLTTRPQLRVRVVKYRDLKVGWEDSVWLVVGDQGGGVTRGDQRGEKKC